MWDSGVRATICFLRQNSSTEMRYADTLAIGSRPGSVGGTLKSEYFYVDVEGEFCRVATENFTCNQGYAVGHVASESPSSGPNCVYDEVDELRGPMPVNDMTRNAGYAETKL